jgi:PhnB protein
VGPRIVEEDPMAVDPIPADYPRVTPYLSVDGAADAVSFYRDVLGAIERGRMTGPDGRVGHAELTVGDSVIMLADSFPEMGNASPRSLGGTPVTIMVYVDDVDAVFAKAISSGAKETRAVEDQFYGDRSGQFEDPWGHRWNVASHIEDVPPDEMERRAARVMST